MTNKLILGDNLEVLKSLPDESVDLIYIDPPFFSNRNYAVIWGDKGEIRSFEDCWDGGVDTYINWMYKRVTELHRVLKPTGSMYLHCDWHADAELKVYVMNKIFGVENFHNAIIWQRTSSNTASNQFGRNSDTIFWYSKTKDYTFNLQFGEHDKTYLDNSYKNNDGKGFWKSDDLTGASINKNDLDWKGYNPSLRNRHWAIPVKPIVELVGEDKQKTMTTTEKLELLEQNNYIVFTSNGTPRFKRYLDNSKGRSVQQVWTDISNVSSQAKERIGYPTQKPEALLERIIKASSNEGDRKSVV